jgi:hypothetical protein
VSKDGDKGGAAAEYDVETTPENYGTMVKGWITPEGGGATMVRQSYHAQKTVTRVS